MIYGYELKDGIITKNLVFTFSDDDEISNRIRTGESIEELCGE